MNETKRARMAASIIDRRWQRGDDETKERKGNRRAPVVQGIVNTPIPGNKNLLPAAFDE